MGRVWVGSRSGGCREHTVSGGLREGGGQVRGRARGRRAVVRKGVAVRRSALSLHRCASHSSIRGRRERRGADRREGLFLAALSPIKVVVRGHSLSSLCAALRLPIGGLRTRPGWCHRRGAALVLLPAQPAAPRPREAGHNKATRLIFVPSEAILSEPLGPPRPGVGAAMLPPTVRRLCSLYSLPFARQR